jgi:enoyl-CoA hydratase/carnithine racemase
MQQFEFGEHLHVQCEEFVATVEIRRPPHNHFDIDLVSRLGDALELLDREPACRAIVLTAAGKSFCAGANLNESKPRNAPPGHNLYKQGIRLFRTRKPIVAAVHGAAVGGGLGLAMVADFRVTCDEARFSANFSRLGTHPGFGLTATLPRVVGAQQAALLFYTGHRIDGAEAFRIGLADVLVAQADVRSTARQLAADIATSAPLSVMSVRETMRRGLAEAVEIATEREFVEQRWQFGMEDFDEGVNAMTQRRKPVFHGR